MYLIKFKPSILALVSMAETLFLGKKVGHGTNYYQGEEFKLSFIFQFKWSSNMQMTASNYAWELESLYVLIWLPVYQAWPTSKWGLLPHFQHSSANINSGFESVISVIAPTDYNDEKQSFFIQNTTSLIIWEK